MSGFRGKGLAGAVNWWESVSGKEVVTGATGAEESVQEREWREKKSRPSPQQHDTGRGGEAVAGGPGDVPGRVGSQKGPQRRDCRCSVIFLNKCPDFHAALFLFSVSHKMADSLWQGLTLTFIQAPLPPHLAPGPGSGLEQKLKSEHSFPVFLRQV